MVDMGDDRDIAEIRANGQGRLRVAANPLTIEAA
jgi:hypothetical protein